MGMLLPSSAAITAFINMFCPINCRKRQIHLSQINVMQQSRYLPLQFLTSPHLLLRKINDRLQSNYSKRSFIHDNRMLAERAFYCLSSQISTKNLLIYHKQNLRQILFAYRIFPNLNRPWVIHIQPYHADERQNNTQSPQALTKR